jgi:hypothetical protein
VQKTIFSASPGKNGSTHTEMAAAAPVLVNNMYQMVPRTYTTTVPVNSPMTVGK